MSHREHVYVENNMLSQGWQQAAASWPQQPIRCYKQLRYVPAKWESLLPT